MPKLVESPSEVLACFRQFQLVREKNCGNYTFDNFGKFYNWYYFPDEHSFAPGKFLGYIGTTICSYKGEGHGARTKRTLDKYFKKTENANQFAHVLDMLKKFACDMGLSISARTQNSDGGLYIPRKEYVSVFGCYQDWH